MSNKDSYIFLKLLLIAKIFMINTEDFSRHILLNNYKYTYVVFFSYIGDWISYNLILRNTTNSVKFYHINLQKVKKSRKGTLLLTLKSYIPCFVTKKLHSYFVIFN